MKNIKTRTETLLKKAYQVCQKYQSLPFKDLHSGRLKDTQMWTTLETLCKVLDIDDCWVYQELTGIYCDCNRKTKSKVTALLAKVKEIKK